MAKHINDNPFLRGLDPDSVRFEDNKAMVEAMSNPIYSKNTEEGAAYRQLVQHMLGNQMKAEKAATAAAAPVAGVVSGWQRSRAMADVPALQRANQQAIAEEHTRNLFMKKDENGDLLYEKSAIYREEVKQFLAANTPAIDAEMGHRLRDVNVSRHAYRIQLGQDGDMTEGIRQANRQAKIEQAQAAAAERKAEVDAAVKAEIDELNATARPDHDEFSPI